MTIGERIKKIRVFRKMTMDDLGGALGFEGKNMSVRISQYETGARIPGEDMILKLADALHCNCLLYTSGMRLGELLALTMEDFDFEKNTVRINKSYQRLQGQDVISNSI